MKKHREMQKELHVVCIDPDKAYDRVPRQEMWRCLRFMFCVRSMRMHEHKSRPCSI